MAVHSRSLLSLSPCARSFARSRPLNVKGEEETCGRRSRKIQSDDLCSTIDRSHLPHITLLIIDVVAAATFALGERT